ncbi:MULTISPECIES: hypothetical protein [unclassified Ruegeria]|uniref:hypothetical protein n=1 Tax=unclassified Ruegeria TaxID=2625375 RepID=UPI001ADD57B1|nr:MULTISPECIES: hypothetical protein [unclassified Ruegeria]MBO9412342.1 hypothetical protein [Ruegeria sp. R8_1]MBO9416420.1 hypothetical protein [Ruegeria sp. R8_2]
MKPVRLASVAVLAATPAMAHTDHAFHTHGSEVFLVLAGVAVMAFVAFRSKG